MVKIVHLTSAHTRYDIRIFVKMCKSLAKIENFDVALVVADGNGDEIKDSINIYDVGKLKGRVNRIFKTTKKIYQKAKELKADIYHFHDPELIPIGLKLKKLGYKVIFDAHEDLPKQLLSKPYLNKLTSKILSKSIGLYKKIVCKKFDYIITATPWIRDKFFKINQNSIDINNYPILNELLLDINWNEKKDEVCYIGGISKIRGIEKVVQSMEYVKKIKLNLVGSFSSQELKNKANKCKGWEKVNEFGLLDRNEMSKIMNVSKAGIVTFLPVPNHIDAQPNKMFEYMSAGLPVIGSNFPLWRDIIEKNNCGICVDPLDPKEIANAIQYIIANSKEAKRMGENGIKAIKEKYNWSIEEQKLYKIYQKVIEK